MFNVIWCNVNLQKLLSAHKSHVRNTSLLEVESELAGGRRPDSLMLPPKSLVDTRLEIKFQIQNRLEINHSSEYHQDFMRSGLLHICDLPRQK